MGRVGKFRSSIGHPSRRHSSRLVYLLRKKLSYDSDPSKSVGLRKENRGDLYFSRLFINIKLIRHFLVIRNRSKSRSRLPWDLYDRGLMVSDLRTKLKMRELRVPFFSYFFTMVLYCSSPQLCF